MPGQKLQQMAYEEDEKTEVSIEFASGRRLVARKEQSEHSET